MLPEMTHFEKGGPEKEIGPIDDAFSVHSDLSPENQVALP
jgi:hypothetical protein